MEKDNIKIGIYEDWMKDQAVDLFCNEYGKDKQAQAEFFTSFYDHPFQKDNALIVTAVDGDKVVGFQSYFYWPYRYQGKVYRSFESGNSLVHPDYRGKRIFSRLLKFFEERAEEFSIDFFVGFPVQMSFGSFIRKNWVNVSNLRYLMKIHNPFSILRSSDYSAFESSFTSPFKEINYSDDEGIIRKEFSSEYYEWQNGYRKKRKHLFYNFESEKGIISFELKLRTKKSVLKEIAIGDIRRSSTDIDLFEDAIKALTEKISALKFVTISVVALNAKLDDNLIRVLKKYGYRFLKKEVYFIAKQINKNLDIPLLDPSKWEFYRLDIDSW